MNLISTIDKPKAVQTLAEIVVSRHGKAFVLDSEPEAAKLGVEILDYVSCDLSSPFSPSGGLVRVSQIATSNPPRRTPSFPC